MKYLNIKTGMVRDYHVLKTVYPHISIPLGHDLPELGELLIRSSQPPATTRWETVVEAAPTVVDGVAYQQWRVEPLPLSLDDKRAELLAAITAERDRREEAGFPYRGMMLDSTPRSVQRITAVALAAQAALAAGQPFQLDWTCADNRTLSLDAAGVIGMPVALAQHAAALHTHARQLKAAVEIAVSDDELAIELTEGWPV